MAQNEVTFTLRITDNNTLQLVTRDAKKAAGGLRDVGDATDRAAGATDRYHRGQKGVIGATANGTKSFSKMRDAIGGSSGLVGAYATLAANVFALSAAFNALNRASKVDQLAKSIEFLSASSGDNLNRISKNLVEVTGNAISMADAMKAASFGTSAGFDSSQLETLAKVAKGASAALGRDLNDSFDRLTRGAAKLEPEILDELGIIVRIDSAVSKYAANVGKNVKELTAWERQQAFVNAINDQGIRKYGELADSIQASPFEKLSAAVENASNAALKFVTEVLKLPQLINYLANDTIALTGAFVLFASTISKQVLPAAYALPNLLAGLAKGKSEAAVKAIGAGLDETIEPLKQLGEASKEALGDLSASLAEGTVDTNKFKEASIRLDRSISQRSGKLAAAEGRVAALNAKVQQGIALTAEEAATLARNQRAIQSHTTAIQQATAARNALTAAQEAGTAATTANSMANAVNALGTGPIIEGLRAWGAALSALYGQMIAGPGVIARLGAAFGLLSGVLSGTLTLVLRFLGPIGLLISLYPLVSDLLSKFLSDTDPKAERAAKAVEEVSKKTQELNEHLRNVSSKIKIDVDADPIDRAIESVTRFTGVLREISSVLASVYDNLLESFSKVVDEAGRADLRAQEIETRLDIKKLEREAGAAGITLDVNYVVPQGEIVKPEYDRAGTPIRDEYFLSTAQIREKEFQEQYLILLEKEKQIKSEIADYTQEMYIGTAENTASEMLKVVKTFESVDVKKIIEDMPKDVAEVTQSEIATKVEELKKKIAEYGAAINTALKQDLPAIAVAKATALDNYVRDSLDSLRSKYEEFGTKQNEIADNASNVKSAFTDFAKAGATRFSPLIESLEKFNQKMEGSTQLSEELGKLLGKAQDRSFAEIFKGVDSKALEEQLRKGQAAEASIPGLELAAKNSAAIAAMVPAIPEAGLKALEDEKAVIEQKVISQQAFVNGLKIANADQSKITAAINEQEELSNSLIKIEAEKVSLGEKRREIELDIEKSAISLEEIKQATLQNEQKLANFQKTGSFELTYSQQRSAIIETTKLKIRAAKFEFDSQKNSVKFEIDKYKLIIDQLLIRKLITEEQAKAYRISAQAISDQSTAAQALHEERIRQIESERDLQLAELTDKTRTKTAPRMGTTATTLPEAGAFYDAAAVGRDITEARNAAIDAQMDPLKKQKKELEEVIAKGNSEGADLQDMLNGDEAAASLVKVQERLDAIKQNKDSFTNLKVGLETARVASEAFIESLKSLGPEGVAVAAAVAGTQNMVGAWANAFDTMKDSTASFESKTVALLGAVSSSLSALSATMSAASANRIAGIDAEIEAEQRRDGKSKESVARIAALEKKKEQEKKKAFEANKKMMMAQTVINTAAGIMVAIGQDGPLGFAVAALIAAMGAAQLAIISGMTYNGGSSSAAGAPSSLAIGQRTSSIDMAKSQSASGELAYLRGEQGMGGPESFRPAFTGMKYRASGGATTGFMVGEQGPELFIPDRPGTIVPADETAGMGGVTNVNFAISAIDTQGVEDMLENQKGTIINMIRQAANSYGQPFIEQVDTSVYRPAPKSRTYRR